MRSYLGLVSYNLLLESATRPTREDRTVFAHGLRCDVLDYPSSDDGVVSLIRFRRACACSIIKTTVYYPPV
jgi:hypothetical protein